MRKLFLTRNDCYKRNVAKADSRYTRFQNRGPVGIMMHSTGANNPNLSRYVGPDDGILGGNIYGNHWNNPSLDVCVHAFIGKTDDGDVECYQTLPWNYRGWHCGAEANDTHIGIEICEDNLTSAAYFRVTRDKALDVVSELCMKYGLNPLTRGVLIDHSEGASMGIASNHGDVAHWWSRFGYTMSDFRNDVYKKITKNAEDNEMTREETEKLIDEKIKSFMSAKGTGDIHSAYADDAVEWAKKTGVVNGYENGDFGWKKPVTLERFITMLHRNEKE